MRRRHYTFHFSVFTLKCVADTTLFRFHLSVFTLKCVADATVFVKNYGSRSKKGEFLRFELNHNALNRKPQK